MTFGRFGLCAVAFFVNAALLLPRSPPDTAWLHPVAPPLSHVPALAEPTLGPPAGEPPRRQGLRDALARTVHTSGDPAQRAALDALLRDAEALREDAERARALRVAIEEDAAELAVALGPERVGIVLAERDALAERIGEGRIWAEAIRRVSP